jgi:hypothetical protein
LTRFSKRDTVPQLWKNCAQIAFGKDVGMLRRTRDLLWLIGIIPVIGCAQWSTPPATDLTNLPLPKLAPDSVVLEVTFVRIPEEKLDFETRFWPEADESALDVELRRRLAANGFRAGVVRTPPPPVLQELFDSQSVPNGADGTTTLSGGSEIAVRAHRLRSRAGQPSKVIVRGTTVPKMAALVSDESGRIRGESLDQAQAFFTVTSYTQSDGQIRVEMVPTIEHGQQRPRFKGQQGAWIVDNSSRPAKTFDDLQIAATLSPGQAVAIGCSEITRGLGEQFFAADSAEQVPRLLLIVRLQQTQADERFAPEELPEPTVTSPY